MDRLLIAIWFAVAATGPNLVVVSRCEPVEPEAFVAALGGYARRFRPRGHSRPEGAWEGSIQRASGGRRFKVDYVGLSGCQSTQRARARGWDARSAGVNPPIGPTPARRDAPHRLTHDSSSAVDTAVSNHAGRSKSDLVLVKAVRR